MTISQQNSVPPVNVGDVISLRIEGLAAGGEFVGRLGNFAVFVSGTAPAETAKVEITEVSRNFGRARLVSVEQPSPDRIQPRCEHFGVCGGCDLQHIYYPAQLAQKTRLIDETLKRIGGFKSGTVKLPDAIGMNDPWHYRNKAEYFAGIDNAGKIFFGFHRKNTHEVIAIEECHLQHPLNEKIRHALTELANRYLQGAEEKHALVKVISRVSFAEKRACVTVVTLGKPVFVIALGEALMKEVPEISGICHSRIRKRGIVHRSPEELVVGDPYLQERIGNWYYRISPDSFFQVNPQQTKSLIEIVDAFTGIGEEEILIEGYSGVGTFLIPLASKARMATGIEDSDSALSDARNNARKNNLENTRFYEGKVENILPRFAGRRWHAGVVVLDPPRKGCGKAVIIAAAKLHPRAIVIVSCDPATLARDLRFADEAGYRAKIVQVVDMFPHTWHAESVALCVAR